VGLSRAAGLALGPFLFGLGSVLALGLFRGASHGAHLGALIGFLCLTAIGAAFLRSRDAAPKSAFTDGGPFNFEEWVTAAATGFAAVALLFISIFVPLTQNDALEYAIVAREFYATRDLLSYPVLNSENNLSGFYGPWTHPPLYVALLYMAEVIQGHADAPGLMRLISPWFLLTGAYVTYALGALVNRITGLLACLIFMSPPLIFLGAGQSLIDPLPVLGFSLIIAVVVGLSARPLVFGATVGGFLGLALWTHSQAILFIPLALAAISIERGLRDWRGLGIVMLTLLVVALAIGGWPYWRNIALFGAPVSDNPAVFAMPELHWDDYFSISRGLDSSTAMIQYGILKGWFAPESYGFIFWGMTVGMALFLAGQRLKAIRQLVLDGAWVFERGRATLWLMGGLLIVYIVGVILSVVLGIEHLVKNERYLLVTLPMVAVLCAYGYVRVAKAILPRLRIANSALVAALALVFCLQVSVFVYYKASKHGMGAGSLFSSMAEKLYFRPEYSLVKWMNDNINKEGIVFSMKPADMYYSKIRMVSYLDARLLSFYSEADTRAAYRRLLNLGVTHIHVPDYGLPPLYNSRLYAILRDPSLSALAFQTVGGKIYALGGEALAPGPSISLSTKERQWAFQTSILLGARKGFAKTSQENGVFEGSAYVGGLPYDLFHRHRTSGFKIGVGPGGDLPDAEGGLKVEPSTQYGLDMRVRGTGFVTVTLEQFAGGDDGTPVRLASRMQIASFELSADQPERAYGVRFVTDPVANRIVVSIESMGTSSVRIEQASCTSLIGAR